MRSDIRRPAVAGQFYEGRRASLEDAVTRCVGDFEPPDDLGDVLGGVAPHAGWVFSGPTAGKVFATLTKLARPDTFVLFGAVHRYSSDAAAIFPRGRPDTWA